LLSGERVVRDLILVVDDSGVTRKLMQMLLESEGFRVLAASNADDALAVLRVNRPRLILMDIQLPGMDGFALTRLLKGDPATRDILIVALTSSSTREDEERIRAAGCDGYVAKPIDILTIPLLLNDMLAALDPKPAGEGEPR
jgi:two-component system, cell cycle response regulator DivK